MKSINFLFPILAALLLQSCNAYTQNVQPIDPNATDGSWNDAPNDYNFVYIKYTAGQIVSKRVGMTDEKKAYQDANTISQDSTRIADLLPGRKFNSNTVKTDYKLEYYLLDAAPCDYNGRILINPVTNKPYQVWIAVDGAALQALELLAKDTNDGKVGTVSVSKGSTWYANSLVDMSNGIMQTAKKYGTFYTY